MRISFENKAEQLDYELGYLIDHSKDRQFTGFLYQMRGELCCQPEKHESIRKRVISNYDVYVNNMASKGKPVESYYFRAIYKGVDTPVILSETVSEPHPVEKKPVEITSEFDNLAAFMPQEKSRPLPEHVDGAAEEKIPEIVSDPVVNRQPVSEQQPAPSPQPVSEPQPAFAPQPAYQQPAVNSPEFHAKAQPPKAEYAVGAIVMSILGAVFLLTGLVYFAVNYLGTFMQGMLMYLAFIGVLLVSEFVIRKLIVKLSSVFTAIGLSGLFLATVVNYRSLNNLSLPVTAFILGLCAVLVCLFGYYRKSRLYSAIGFFAAFASSAAIGSDSTPVQYLVITIGTLLISCLWMIFPVEKQYNFADTFMIVAEFIYFLIGTGFRIDCDDDMTVRICKFVFLICSWIVTQFIYFHTARRNPLDENSGTGTSIPNRVIMCIFACFYTSYATAGVLLSKLDPNMIILSIILLYVGFIVPSAFFALKLYNSRNRAWITFWILMNITGLTAVFASENGYIIAAVIVAHSIVSRYICSRLSFDYTLKITDLLIQIVMGIVLVFSSQMFAPEDGSMAIEMYVVCAVLSAAFVIGLFFASGYKDIVQVIGVFSVTVGIINVFLPDSLKAACGMGLILLFTCLINSVERLKPDKNTMFNWFALVMESLFLIMAATDNTSFALEDCLIYIISMLFGLSFTILMLNKDYGMPFNGKYIAVPGYLTVAFIISPLNKDFLLSILLMTVAVGSVIFGFVLKEKAIRVYGLVLSIIVCAKIAFIDFVTLDDAKAKTVMYIMVGAFALLIGTIYMVLESRENKAVAKKTEQGAS